MSRDTEEANAFVFYTLVGIILLLVALLLLAVTGVSPAESSCDDPAGTPRGEATRATPSGSRTPHPTARPTNDRPGCGHTETPTPSPDPTSTLDPTETPTRTAFPLPTLTDTPRPKLTEIQVECGVNLLGTPIVCHAGGG